MNVYDNSSFAILVRKANTFPDLIELVLAEEQRLLRLFEPVKTSNPQHNRGLERVANRHRRRVKILEARRQQYAEWQVNMKITAALKKKIADLLFHITRAEPGLPSSDPHRLQQLRSELADVCEQVERRTNPPKPLTTTNEQFVVGGNYTGQSITKAYDGHVWEVLKGHFERLPQAKGKRTNFRVVACLPQREEYLQLKEGRFTRSVVELVEDAYLTIRQLQAELEEAYENMPESLQGSAVGQAREATAAELETISDGEPTPPKSISSLRLVHFPSPSQKSRSDCAREAATMLRAASVLIQSHLNDKPKMKAAERKLLEEFRRELDDHADDIQNVEFPGMYGF